LPIPSSPRSTASKHHAFDDMNLPASPRSHGTSEPVSSRKHSLSTNGGEGIPAVRPQVDEVKEELAPEAVLHHLFDMLTSFNTLFFATTQLAMTTIEFSNILFTITEIEHKSKHNPF
jgi:hypothetical protein